MPIEKMQSQTTTHHVCGGGGVRLTDICGLFAGLLGARWFRDVTVPYGRTVGADAAGCIRA